uniref:Probable thiopurine S-methyltransferase n=1 Tax=Anoplopoma fimbria TaxID=229290 RepID=C3KHY0_ANOFI|nr:Probable thiopurine S-methyltransferase [Anoplopoma fimbria]
MSGVLLLIEIVFCFDRMLENNIDKVLAGRTGVRFFFPLCGKAVDMKWYKNAYYIQ